MAVRSELGRGTTFTVRLRATTRTPEALGAAVPQRPLGGSETILLVEDDPAVRDVACASLRRKGYHVLECSNGVQALEASDAFAGVIDLLLTDVVMPRMGGRRLVEELSRRRPGVKVLFAPGHADETIGQQGVVLSGFAFLQKPFTPQRLLRKVRDVLEDSPPARSIFPV